jgi:hypothetical protein
VRFNVPLASLRFLFPGMWPEVASSDEPRSAALWPLPLGTDGPALIESRPVAG